MVAIAVVFTLVSLVYAPFAYASEAQESVHAARLITLYRFYAQPVPHPSVNCKNLFSSNASLVSYIKTADGQQVSDYTQLLQEKARHAQALLDRYCSYRVYHARTDHMPLVTSIRSIIRSLCDSNSYIQAVFMLPGVALARMAHEKITTLRSVQQ